MNASANLPAKLSAGGAVAAIVARDFDEAYRIGRLFAASGLAPKGMASPEACAVAIMAGAEVGFAPFQAIQSFAVVNGRPTLWGDALPAILWRSGFKLREWAEGETAFCEVTRPDGEKIVRSFSQADAVKAGLASKDGPWRQYPQRMRQMRARAWAARDGAADALRGVAVREEVEDYGDARMIDEAPRPSPAEAFAAETVIDAEPTTIEVVDDEPEPDPNGGGGTPAREGQDAADELATADEPEAVDLAPRDLLAGQAEGEAQASLDLDETLDGEAFEKPALDEPSAPPRPDLAADLTHAHPTVILAWADVFEEALRSTSLKSSRAKYWQVAREAGRIARLSEVDLARATALHALANGKEAGQ